MIPFSLFGEEENQTPQRQHSTDKIGGISPFSEKTEKRVLTTAKDSAKITIKFNKCFLKGCDEDGQELKFTESQWLV